MFNKEGNRMDVVLVFCTMILVISLTLSIIISKRKIEKTGKVFHDIIPVMLMNFIAGILAAIIWFNYYGPINEFGTFFGIIYLMLCTILSVIIYVLFLILMRKRMLNRYYSNHEI